MSTQLSRYKQTATANLSRNLYTPKYPEPSKCRLFRTLGARGCTTSAESALLLHALAMHPRAPGRKLLIDGSFFWMTNEVMYILGKGIRRKPMARRIKNNLDSSKKEQLRSVRLWILKLWLLVTSSFKHVWRIRCCDRSGGFHIPSLSTWPRAS